MRVKYLATYQGPSYGSWEAFESMDAFSSLRDARGAMQLRQRGYDYVTTYKENKDEFHVLWESSAYYQFPGTSPEDIMELYMVTEATPGVYHRHMDPVYRLSIGPRGGVITEKH